MRCVARNFPRMRLKSASSKSYSVNDLLYIGNTMSKNVLITGGAGFIGSRLAISLLKSNHSVTVLDNLLPQIHGDDQAVKSLTKYGCKTLIGDVRDSALVEKALHNQNIVFHLAAETGTGQSMYEVKKYNSANIDGTVVLLESVKNSPHNIERFVLGSSRSVYGEGKYLCKEHGVQYPLSRNDSNLKNQIFDHLCESCGEILQVLPTDERSLTMPNSIYAATKRYQEDLFRIYGSMLSIPTSVFRFQNVYGPGQSLSNPYTGILSIFSNLIKNYSQIDIFEDGFPSRDFVYVDDVIHFLRASITDRHRGVSIFNVGSGVRVSVLEVIQELEKNIGIGANCVVSGNSRAGDIRHNVADLTALFNRFGNHSFVSFADGVESFVSWAKTSGKNNTEDYERSINELKANGLLK